MQLYHDLQACHSYGDKSSECVPAPEASQINALTGASTNYLPAHHDGFKGPSGSFLSIIPLSWRPHDMGNGISHLVEYCESLLPYPSESSFPA